MDWVHSLCRRGPVIKHQSTMENKPDFTEVRGRVPTDLRRMRCHLVWPSVKVGTFAWCQHNISSVNKVASVPACPDFSLKAAVPLQTQFPNPGSDRNSGSVWRAAWGNNKVKKKMKPSAGFEVMEEGKTSGYFKVVTGTQPQVERKCLLGFLLILTILRLRITYLGLANELCILWSTVFPGMNTLMLFHWTGRDWYFWTKRSKIKSFVKVYNFHDVVSLNRSRLMFLTWIKQNFSYYCPQPG